MGRDADIEDQCKDENIKLLSNSEDSFTPNLAETFKELNWRRKEQHWIYKYTHIWAVITLTICVVFYVAWLFGSHPWASETTVANAPKRKALILSSYDEQDTRWMEQLSNDWETYKYYMDRPDAVYHVPRNFGREVMTYTTYIIDHYDSLPDYMVFTHGHERSWHQAEPMVWKINSLNFTALDMDHFIALRCNHSPTCHLHNPIDLNEMQGEDRIYVSEIPAFWRYAKLGEYRDTGDRLPKRLSSPCCAQFAVTKEAVKRRSRDWWRRYRSPLMNQKVYEHGPLDTWDWGMMYEKLWHVAFGMDAFFCPPERYCFETQWSNGILCDGYPTTPLWGIWHTVYKDITCWKNVNNTRGWEYLEWTTANYTEGGKPKPHTQKKPDGI